MQFLINECAKDELILVQNEALIHLKARRMRLKDRLYFRNLKDDFLYLYELESMDKRGFAFRLVETLEKKREPSFAKLALSVIDIKITEKLLPFLNELDLNELFFVYADFSQKNFKLDLARLERILMQSCQQCGRTNLMKLSLFESSKDFLSHCEKEVLKPILLDFEGENLDAFLQRHALLSKESLNQFVFFVGAEGGFSSTERKLFKAKISLKNHLIMRSQTAAVALASKLLV